MKKELL